ncbi:MULTISPECIES: glycine--tRNA ligase subunit beta [unclassified Sphingopyxis]|uniref:glycine--tRNA ligase subunit beta n=1 Tax=unclassified Sphingopyxis TaxID=2614943 RepID=UPI0028567E1A|nr:MULTISPECIES: glycine--tRNA ligase subunit beta [unclassified Sphingopyxis]MDR6831888.1 glycyl-tRNA synthetase beta chain [Sphingopyxis sp. BE122]MDR7227630.1 glycyl-tRNA synthetase beta chain [Sphingopyxis sp. BE259]
MTDFLLELRSEEIPARMQAGARAELDKLFRAQMSAAGIDVGDLSIWSTPRRLALIAKGLPDATAAVSEELKGPRSSAPPQALEGFLRKTGLTQDQLEDRDGVYFAVIDKPGRATAEVLAEAIPAIVRAFAWPKSMRWGKDSASSESLRWVRPLSGIVAIFGDALVPCEVSGVAAGFATRGHRFHCPGEINIGSAADYAEKLRACHVIVDHEERQAIIRDGAAKAAADAGLKLVEDEGLVIENAGLTEWPVPLLGRFDEAFLEVPPEVIQLTARVNQKYFVVNDAVGKLANGFVCTANIAAHDGGAEIVAGNRKVLAARLSDARFFWEQDQKKTLAQHAEKLANITFHEKLGTVAAKVERVAKLARYFVEQGIVPYQPRRSEAGPHATVGPWILDENTANERAERTHMAELAGRLAKADLVTEMVGEFPELQGLMGGYYARARGLSDAVADAIQDHYKPVGQGDSVPTAPVTVAVALADKLDTLTRFFLADETPTGSKDPFALRRAALGVIAIILQNRLRFRLEEVLLVAIGDDLGLFGAAWDNHAEAKLAAFFADRLKVQQREAGVRHDLIDAVFALGGEDDLVRLLARVKALQAFMASDDGANLLAGYKRAANILKQAGQGSPANAGAQGGTEPTVADARAGLRLSPESMTVHDAALLAALDTAEPAAAAAVAEERFTDAMAALASLRAPIDAFFDGVMVNDPDEDVRAYRLGLLARFTGAVHGVADFSKIEG